LSRLSPPVGSVSNPSRQRFDASKALKLRLVHKLTFEQIGAVLGVGAQAVHRRLAFFKPFTRDPDALQAYAEHKSEVSQAVEARLMASLVDEETISKASLNNRAYALKQVHEIGRLERGQSTANVGILSKVISQADDELFRGKSTGSGNRLTQGIPLETAQPMDKTNESDKGK